MATCEDDLAAMTALRDAALVEIGDLNQTIETLTETVEGLEEDVARLEHRRILPEHHGTFTYDGTQYKIMAPQYRLNGVIVTASQLKNTPAKQEELINLESDIIVPI